MRGISRVQQSRTRALFWLKTLITPSTADRLDVVAALRARVVVGDQRDVRRSTSPARGPAPPPGYWVMLITSQPCSENQRLSARVEKRGPWITTTVPRSWTVMPARGAAVDGELAAAPGSTARRVLMCTVVRPVVECRRAREVRSTNWSQTTKSPGSTCGCRLPEALGPEDPGHAERRHRPDVGAVVDRVRRVLVPGAVARQERHAARRRSRRCASLSLGRPIRRLDRYSSTSSSS